MCRFTVHSSWTDDHMVLAAEDFKGCVPKKLTVRTATVDQLESVDSAAVRLPPALIREVTAGTARAIATDAMRATNLRKVRDETGLLVIWICRRWDFVLFSFPLCACSFRFFCELFPVTFASFHVWSWALVFTQVFFLAEVWLIRRQWRW